MSEAICSAFFLGMGGLPFSLSWNALASKVEATGVSVYVFDYTDYAQAARWLQQCALSGYKTAVAGYSAGVTSATLIQQQMPVDLLISVAASTYDGANNHPVAKTTRRSHLFYGTDAFSDACRDDAYDEKTLVTAGLGIYLLSHLLIPVQKIVIDGVLAEFAELRGSSQ